MAGQQTSKEYSSYLLRLRLVRTHPLVWHASLQDVRTGELYQFMELTQLYAFIEQVAQGNSRSPAPDTPDSQK